MDCVTDDLPIVGIGNRRRRDKDQEKFQKTVE
jgi:hypothetical protein